MVTTGGEGHFKWANPVKYWYKGVEVSDYNFNGQGELLLALLVRKGCLT